MTGGGTEQRPTASSPLGLHEDHLAALASFPGLCPHALASAHTTPHTPLLLPSGPRRIVHSSMFPKASKRRRTSSSDCCLLSIPTKSFLSSRTKLGDAYRGQRRSNAGGGGGGRAAGKRARPKKEGNGDRGGAWREGAELTAKRGVRGRSLAGGGGGTHCQSKSN